MTMRSFSVKLALFFAYFMSIIFFVFPPFLIATIIFHVNLRRKEKKFREELERIGFNNYREIETGKYKYLIFNDDGRFMETIHRKYELFDIKDYNVEFEVPNKNNQSVDVLAGYMLAGSLGAFAAVNKPCYLILRKKGQENFTEPTKYVICGKKSIENMYNLLIFFKEKGYIE